MLVNFGFYEIKTSQQVHYPFPNCCVHVALQFYTLENFPYAKCIEQWSAARH